MRLPTCLFGYVRGSTRWEEPGGRDRYIGYNRFWINQKPFEYPPSAITHLQKISRFGFLLMWPFCFHVYFTFKFQQRNENGGWIPGSERVFYARTPGYRWDAGDDKYIKTGGYIGLHFD